MRSNQSTKEVARNQEGAENYVIKTVTTMDADKDLMNLEKDQLIAEIVKLRNAIREHRDSTGQELCWHHPKLWDLLPEKTDPEIEVPEWPEFMKGCIRYRMSLEGK